MTGLRSRHPADKPDHRRSRQTSAAGRVPAALIRPGYVNVCLCNMLVLSFLLVPFALFFSVRHADPAERLLAAHYLYVRTTIAVLVIGTGLGSLMILLGAPVSSALMLAGLGLIGVSFLLTLLRCLNGFYRALRGLPHRNAKSYFV